MLIMTLEILEYVDFSKDNNGREKDEEVEELRMLFIYGRPVIHETITKKSLQTFPVMLAVALKTLS